MDSKLYIYNTLTRKKELFKPINPPFVGLYACGPTVYGDAHLGHARQAVTFDVLFRFLSFLGYKVRYIRNITDVGHLESDADEGEDKIQKKARIEKLEPMEVVQYYMNRYHENMRQLNVLPPSIEPRATGHIIEQQQLIKKIIDAGYAYIVNGSVYFDVMKYDADHHYGKLSGRKIDDLLSNTRALEGQSEKKNPLDFALWKKADPAHIMHWPSEWSEGYPGWHVECSAMSTKYLGVEFDIHGGGMDLLFPHHECEIAQSVAGYGKDSVRYWMHNNMITINGQKMGRSLGNFITLDQLFAGNHEILEQSYDPMVVRLFILQAHYRSTLDFSNESLQASEKGLKRFIQAAEKLGKIQASGHSTLDPSTLGKKCLDAMNDDLNTPVLLAHLFEATKWINAISAGQETITTNDLDGLKKIFSSYLSAVLGISLTGQNKTGDNLAEELIRSILNLRTEAKNKQDFALADRIRNELNKLGITIKDGKDGVEWEI
ncbi:MAG: cysteine--tRNA ligase [Bacteroidales bacterium]|nr:cysteine--tRNA ligase [Bacteroidales bacterium]MBN2699050.1 cysteine--tRNA ligase [Bacteroidales bacterium]